MKKTSPSQKKATMNVNIERVLKKFEIESTSDLNCILLMLPTKSKNVFKIKWGLDNKYGKYYSSYTLLAKKLDCDYQSAQELVQQAEADFKASILFPKVYLPQKCNSQEFLKAIQYVALIQKIWFGKIPNTFQPRSLNEIIAIFDEMLSMLPEQESFIIREHFGLNDGNPKDLSKIKTTFFYTPYQILDIERKIFIKWQNPSIKKKFLTNDSSSQVSEQITLTDDIEKLGLLKKTCSHLRNQNINTIEDLTDLTIENIVKIPGLSKQSILEIYIKLQELDFEFSYV